MYATSLVTCTFWAALQSLSLVTTMSLLKQENALKCHVKLRHFPQCFPVVNCTDHVQFFSCLHALLMHFAHCRVYEAEQNSRSKERRLINRARRGRRRRNSSDIPSQLRPLAPFPDWLKQTVEADRRTRSRTIDQTTYDLSRPPSLIATAYRSMKAYGMHLRCRSVEASRTSMDSGVHAIFTDDAGEETEEYVGWVEEILELEYRSTCVVVLLCSWVKGKMGGASPTMKRDQHGFLSMNFSANCLLPLGPHSFAFPIHTHQVFFMADQGPWKVVCKANVRGSRRGRAFAAEYDDAEAQLPDSNSLHANNTELCTGEPSHSDVSAYGSFVEEQEGEPVAAEGSDEDDNRILGDSSDSEFTSED